MAVGTATISRGAGRISRRLDRLSDRKFALLVSVPGLILVALIVLPPMLSVFGLSLFRIELAKDDATPFVVLRTTSSGCRSTRRSWRPSRGRSSSPAMTTAVTLPLALVTALVLNRGFRGVVDLLHGAAHAVGHRVGRGGHLLALHLRHPVRDRERPPDRARVPRRSRSTGSRTRSRRSRSRVVAQSWRSVPLLAVLLLAALKTIPGTLYRAARMDGATAWEIVPLHHAAGDPEHADRRRHPAGHHRPPGVRPAVQPDERRPGPRHLRPDLRDLRHRVPGPQLRLWRRP